MTEISVLFSALDGLSSPSSGGILVHGVIIYKPGHEGQIVDV